MMTVEENNSPQGIEQFNFDQKFKFAGSKKTYQRPVRYLILKARNLRILEKIDAGDGPFNSRIGSLWGKEAPTLKTDRTKWLSAIADIEDDLQVVGDKGPNAKSIDIDLTFTENAETESEHFKGKLHFYGYSLESYRWCLHLNCPSNMATDLVEQVENGQISELVFRISIRDGFIDYESNNYEKKETWWFPRNGHSVWSDVFLNSLTWASKTQLVAMPKADSIENDSSEPAQQGAPAQVVPLSHPLQNQETHLIRSIMYALWLIATILFVQLVW
jgi:hypothetical protein